MLRRDTNLLKPLQSADGFSLLEILVALSIFTFAVLGLAVGTVTITRTNNNSHLNATAINLAQAKLEELRAMKNTAFAALSCTPCTDTHSAAGMTFNRSWTILANNPATGMNRIDVTVGWTDYTAQSMTMSSSVAQ